MHQGTKIKRPVIAAITAGSIVLIDQLSKAVLTGALAPYESVEIIPGLFNIVSVRNPGAAFGLFSGYASIVLSIVSIVAVLVICFLIIRTRETGLVLALALIGGGAVGNLIDRLRIGEVIDFLDFYVGSFHWPAFNAADSAITVGVIIYLVFSYFGKGSKGLDSLE